jgi:Xaa-Pro aminopeptidase
MLKTTVDPIYAARRKRLTQSDPDGLFVFFGRRSGRGYARGREPQAANFYYLSEYPELDAIILIHAGKSTLFTKVRDDLDEVWHGERYGPERAKEIFHFDAALPIESFDASFLSALKDSRRVYFTIGEDAGNDARILNLLKASQDARQRIQTGLIDIVDPRTRLSDMRRVKDAVEIERMRKAAKIAALAHTHLLRRMRAGNSEWDIEAEFVGSILKAGAEFPSYTTIAASGINATTLHYTHNNSLLRLGDLVLVDAGAFVDGYSSDITQTFPIGGQFSADQKTVYQAVLDVQRDVISRVKPGISIRSLQKHTVRRFAEYLIEWGHLKGTLDQVIESGEYRRYFPHGVSHYLGIDVHDVGATENTKEGVPLEQGVVLTIEPGLYFRDAGSRFHGIGVRIEDDVLVTKNGCEVLTSDLVREVAELEELRSRVN